MLKATLIGNLGSDPELRDSASGAPFLRMNIAANYRTRTPEGEWQERTEWVRVTVTGQRAESLSQYLKKGSRVYVEGRLEARPWADRENQVRAGLEVMANEVQFMSSRADDEGGSQQQQTETHAVDEHAGVGRQAAASTDEGELEDLPF